MKIIIDAMGGDNAPGEIVRGALRAVRDLGVSVVLVGVEERIHTALKNCGETGVPSGVEIVNATEIIEMCEDPVSAIRSKRDSSMVVGLRLLQEGKGDAMVSAGSTGALLSGATLIVRRVKGIRRACVAPVIPNNQNGTIIVDAGANSDCSPEYLIQFALMGSFYARSVLGVADPRVGLLNIGTEPSKGAELQLQTYPLLQKLHEEGRIRFVGNIEAKSIMSGDCDVLVCDGFSGNVLLKSVEGVLKYVGMEMKKIFSENLRTKMAFVAVKDGVRRFAGRLDADNVGGTALLGISKVVVKAHGSSNANAIFSAIAHAKLSVEKDVPGGVRANIDSLRAGHDE